MCLALVVVLAVLLSSSVGAKSTGSTLASKTNGYSSATGAQKSSFSMDNDYKRTLLQEPEDPCSECPTWSRLVYNETSTIWMLNDSVLESSVVDIQCIVECANASDTIVVPTNRTLIPSGTITIDKPLIITGFHEDGLTSEGIEPAAEKKTVITCPEGSEQSIFNIQSGGVTIANFEIRDCYLEGDDSPVVEDNKQTNDGIEKAVFVFTGTGTQNDSVILNGLIAKGNRLPLLRAASSFVEILNSNFTGNDLGSQDASMFHFSSSSKIVVRNCRFKDNTGVDAKGMITLESDTSTKIIDSIFSNNTKFGSAFFSTGSELSIWGSDFSANNGTSNGGVIHLANSTANVYWTFFQDNSAGENGGVGYAIESSVFMIRNSDFVNNTASAGGCFYIEDSTADVQKSRFNKNKAGVDGGAIRVEQGGVDCMDTVFEDNDSKNEGGAIHIKSATHVKWQTVRFKSNKVAFGSVVRIDNSSASVILKDVHFHGGDVELTGAALYIDTSNVMIDGATFTNNRAPYGGAIYTQAFTINIKNAVFEKNSASVMGGAISGDNGIIFLENTTFVENHSYLGGALHFYNATLEASDVVFLNNNASEGGALLCKDSNVTIGPREDVEPRIPRSARVDSDSSFGIYAWNNTGIDSGGVIDVKDSNLTIAYGTFSNNRAPEGGAVQFTSSELTFINISNSWFRDNIANVRGGSLAVRSANEGNVSLELSFAKFSRCIADQGGAVFLASVNAVIEDCEFIKNIATEGGAAFFRKNVKLIEKNATETESADISIDVKNCLFKRNTAGDYGGALVLRGEAIVSRSFITSENVTAGLKYAKEGFNVVLKSVNLTENQAYGNGGGVYGEAVGLEILSAEVKGNTAPRGGGAYLMQTRVYISDGRIIDNAANSSGGGIMLVRQSNGIIVWTNFTGNSVSEDGEGGGLSLSGSKVKAEYLYFAHNNASNGGGVSLVPGSKRNSFVETVEVDSSLLCYECTFSENKASKSGGGLNINSQDREVPVVAQLDRCQFEHNSASVFGGGIHFVRPFDQTKNNTSWKSCAHLVILNSSFSNNKAGRSGRSLLSNDPERVLYSCSQTTNVTNPLDFVDKARAMDLRNSQNGDGFCPQWVDPRFNTRDTSPLVASYVRNCKMTGASEGKPNERSSKSIPISETVPGGTLPDILIKCYDIFGQLAKSEDDGFTATLQSKEEDFLVGIFVTNLTGGSGNMTGVRNPPNKTFTSEYSYELEITFSLNYVEAINVLVKVRICRVNEQKDNENGECKSCDATEYNFHPMNGRCKHCHDTLDCSGPYYVFPKDNHWHSSPCHVPAQKCLTADACEETEQLRNKLNSGEFENISVELDTLMCSFSKLARRDYQQLQCKQGYEGVLCGSCQVGFGRSLSLACTKCRGAGFSVFILVSVCLWLAAVAAITIHGSKTIEERLKLVSKQLHNIAAHRRLRFRESIPEVAEIETQEETTEDENARMIPPKNKTLKRSRTGASSSTASTYLIGYNLPTTTVTATGKTPQEINNHELAQLAKWKTVEVLKVTVNFLQAISVAAVINVEWTRYMLTMFNVSALAGGASTALVTRAIQCFPWWNGTKYATYAGLVSSVLVPTFVVLCIVVFFALVAYKTSKKLYFFIKRSVLAALAISYFSYLSVTKVAVMVFYCIGVRTGEFTSPAKTHYWSLDTSIQCADRDHIGLMVFGGILFLLFSVGFPLISAFILVLCRKEDESKDPEPMRDILGFLYRAYKREFVYWESTVMLRKALLSAIAVFSYHLGGHSQGLLASFILSVCLFFQAIYKPYRVEFDTVNDIESLSLLISGITFTFAQFFMKDRTNAAIKVALSVFLMVSIIGFFVYLIFRMLVCVIDVFRTDLRVVGRLDEENAKSSKIVETWVAFKFETWAASKFGIWVATKLETRAASRLGTWVASRLGFSERPGDGDDDVLGHMELGPMKSENYADNVSDRST